MKKYLFIVLLVFFWSCEEENISEHITPSSAIIGCWEVEIDDQWIFFKVDDTYESVDDVGSAYRCNGSFDYTITDDVLTLYDSTDVYAYTYYFSNDFSQLTFTQMQINNTEIESMNYSFGKRDDLEYAQFCD